jgi:hypothetical protein
MFLRSLNKLINFLAISAVQVLHPQGSRGDVDIHISITGYRYNELSIFTYLSKVR